jgi:hypothetical protein
VAHQWFAPPKRTTSNTTAQHSNEHEQQARTRPFLRFCSSSRFLARSACLLIRMSGVACVQNTTTGM